MSRSERGASDLAESVAAATRAWSSLRVLVVGDVMLDEDRLGGVSRVSPEAPVPIVGVREVRRAPGGAANVAHNVIRLGAECELVGVVGDDDEGRVLADVLSAAGLGTAGLVVAEGRPTTHKLRVVAGGRQMVRLDREVTAPLTAAPREAIRARIEAAVERCDLVVLEDYDKGLFADGVGDWIVARARRALKPVMVDPKREVSRFREADLIKPNQLEAEALADGEVGDDAAGRRRLLEKIQTRFGGGEVVVTRGGEGISALDRQGAFVDVPTRSRAVYDVQGAGDTAMAALALARGAGASLPGACIVANAAASVAVSRVGTAAVSRAELQQALPHALRASGLALAASGLAPARDRESDERTA